MFNTDHVANQKLMICSVVTKNSQVAISETAENFYGTLIVHLKRQEH
jgi:hypothetical protein